MRSPDVPGGGPRPQGYCAAFKYAAQFIFMAILTLFAADLFWRVCKQVTALHFPFLGYGPPLFVLCSCYVCHHGRIVLTGPIATLLGRDRLLGHACVIGTRPCSSALLGRGCSRVRPRLFLRAAALLYVTRPCLCMSVRPSPI